MAETQKSAGIQIVGLTTASVFLMTFAFLMYRLDRSGPSDTDTRSHSQWRATYLDPPKPRDAISTVLARRNSNSIIEARAEREPAYDFYNVLPEFNVYVAPDLERSSSVRQARLRTAAATRTTPGVVNLTTNARPQIAKAQPVIIQQQPVIRYSQPAAKPDLIQARSVSASAEAPAEPVWLQVGAFRLREDASRRRAEVALLGLRAQIEPAVIQGSTVFRVKLGPFDTNTSRTKADQRLASAGIESLVRRN